MQGVRLYFARHGESEANVQEVFSIHPEMYGLTDRGKGQAETLADNLSGVDFTVLYCSPVLRAVQTAGIVAARLCLAYEIEDGLREYDVGILEGRRYSKATEEIYWQVTAQWMEAMNWDARIEGGESYNDIAARFMPFIRRLESDHRGTEANILSISHGGILRCMLPLLLSNVDNAFSMAHPVGYTTCVVAELRGGKWACLRWGEETFEM